MSANEPIDCKITKFYEGDVQPGRSISECLLEKMGANLNGIGEAWKLKCKDLTGSGSWTSPDHIFGVFIVAHSMTSNFNLNQFNGEVISFAGQNGFTFIDGIDPNTSYSYSTSGTLTLVCLSC